VTEPRIGTLRAELRDDTSFVATAAPRLSWTVDSSQPGWIQAGADITDGIRTVTLQLVADAASLRGLETDAAGFVGTRSWLTR
jgi:hypothetical protein